MIVDLNSIQPKLGQDKKVVLCHGVFDVIHAGHIDHFQQARNLGGILVVSITPDRYVRKGPNRPLFNETTRAQVLDALRCVDYVVINNRADALDILSTLKPDIYCKGEEVLNCPSGHIIGEQEFVEGYGGQVKFLDMLEDNGGQLSSSRIINNLSVSNELKYIIGLVRELNLNSFFSALSEMNIVVIGEYIKDEYIICSPLNRSGKEMLVAMKYKTEQSFTGGAAIIASNVRNFSKNICLITATDDEHLEVSVPYAYYAGTHPTVRKIRHVEEGTSRKVAELVYNDYPISKLCEATILDFIDKLVPKADLVICADYGHGFFNPKVRSAIQSKAQFLAVMVQTNAANYGFNLINKWRYMDYAVVDEKELRLACSSQGGELKDLMAYMAGKIEASVLCTTLGHQGSMFYRRGDFRYIPAIRAPVVDTIGAGDAFLSITAPLVRMGMPLDAVGLLGNAYGAMKVGLFGNQPVDVIEYKKFLKSLLA